MGQALAPWIAVILVIITIALVTQSYLSRLSLLAIQGFWHISGDEYLLIQDPMLQIVEVRDRVKVLYEDACDSLSCTSVLPFHAHSYKLSRGQDTYEPLLVPFPFPNKFTCMTLYPSSGILQVHDVDGNVIYEFIKDNEMSLAHLRA